MQVIYFCGDDHVGKTTMAQSLQYIFRERFSIDAPILSFASELRNELINLYGLPKTIISNKSVDKKNTIFRLGDFNYSKEIPELFVQFGIIDNVDKFDDLSLSLRDIFVTHGTKIRRGQNDKYWLNHILNHIEKHSYQYIIIDDARSPSDFQLSKKPFIFHLNNSINPDPNLEQSRFHAWLEKNEHMITSKIDVSIPLYRYSAYSINLQHVIPKVLV